MLTPRDDEESFSDARERERRERLHRATGYHSGRRVLLCGLFALSLFLSVAALAFRQATSPEAASNVLGAGIARITDLDRLIAQDLPAANAVGADKDASPLAGFPINIQLKHADVAGKSAADVRALVLSRATARVYDDGVKAFDRTGQQSVSRFSGEGVLTTLANQLTRKNHDRATLALIVLVIVTAFAAGGVLLSAAEEGRTRLIAIGILSAALPGLLLSVAGWFAIGAMGGSDSFEGALRSLARSVADVPLRDFAIVTGLGVIVLFAGPAVSLVARPFAREADDITEPDLLFDDEDDIMDIDDAEFDDDVAADQEQSEEAEARA